MDKEQRQFLEHKLAETVEGRPKMQALHDLLMSHGGLITCLPWIEEDLDKILERGRLWKPRWLREMPSLPSSCHFNAAALWDANRDKPVRIATGYALSDDGIWRQHSWCIFKKEVVVETTVKRVLYFGFAMAKDEANQFYWDNCL